LASRARLAAKALRSIQQNDLPTLAPDKRVLGVIRPTVEALGDITHSRHVGIMATQGTIRSRSYDLEIEKFFPDVKVTGLACPMWVPLVEYGEFDSPGADYFVKKRIDEILRIDPDGVRRIGAVLDREVFEAVAAAVRA